MGNELQVSKSFQDKMRERLQDSIGDLLPDEELKQLIEKSIADTFFKEKIEYNAYGQDKVRPCLMESLIKNLLEQKIDMIVSSYLKENEKTVNLMISGVFEKNIENYLTMAIRNHFSFAFSTLELNIRDQLQHIFNNNCG